MELAVFEAAFALPVGSATNSCAGNLLGSLHHRLLHAVLACPIQADLVAIGIVEIRMPPAPRHHARQLRDVEALLLELAAEAIEFVDFEVQPHSITRD